MNISVTFDQFYASVIFPSTGAPNYKKRIPKEEIKDIINQDALYELCGDEKRTIWNNRWWIQQYIPRGLSRVLESVDWFLFKEVAEMHRLLVDWPPLTYPHEILEVNAMLPFICMPLGNINAALVTR